MALRIVATKPNPRLVTLPWSTPLERWGDDVVVPLPRGISRHVVRIVRLDSDVYAVKETREQMAFREYRLLRDLQRLGLPTVDPVGVVAGRTAPDGSEIEPILVTRHLQFSLPYRSLFSHGLPAESLPRLIDALVVLLVRLHLAGFFWGDVSLSNVLFRRSAGEFAAYLVDAETGELHETLSDGQRAHDLEVAFTNIFGELLDLQAGGLLDEDVDAHEIVERVECRYHDLWTELTATEEYDTEELSDGQRAHDIEVAYTNLFGELLDLQAGGLLDDGVDAYAIVDRVRDQYDALWDELTGTEEFTTDEIWRIEQRIERLNDLGFDVDEVDIVTDWDGASVRVSPCVVEAGHHSRELQGLTGLDVEENQARRLLNDLASYTAYFDLGGEDRPLVAHRWLSEIYEPITAMVPPKLRGRLEPAEVFHEILEHRWFLSEKAGRPVRLFDAARSYIDTVLAKRPEEVITAADDPDALL